MLAERLSRFCQELKQKDGSDYSRSGHQSSSITSAETIEKTFSIVSGRCFKKANIFLNAKLKKIKESGWSKIKHHASIQAEDIRKCYERGVFGRNSLFSLFLY